MSYLLIGLLFGFVWFYCCLLQMIATMLVAYLGWVCLSLVLGVKRFDVWW